jgi:hypothetical protein
MSFLVSQFFQDILGNFKSVVNLLRIIQIGKICEPDAFGFDDAL